MVPSYFGWIAAQLVAFAGMLNLFFGLDMTAGILLVAVVAVGYTLMGGMWSVTLTDAFQISLVMIGLVVLGWTTLVTLGDGSMLSGLAGSGPTRRRRCASPSPRDRYSCFSSGSPFSPWPLSGTSQVRI